MTRRQTTGSPPPLVDLYFSDQFRVKPKLVERYGGFNISLIADLPLFIDPFLIFHSRRPVYRKLHKEIVRYLLFLRDKATDGQLPEGLLLGWYAFKEVKETWLGFSERGNRGSGLGRDFAVTLHSALRDLFPELGHERITKSTHLEKVCLIKRGVGKDRISDFTTRMILDFLCQYTQAFARKHLRRTQRRRFVVDRARFDYRTETWQRVGYTLPALGTSYVLLTPRDLLTKDDTWINRTDLIEQFERIPSAIPNLQLRAQIENYYRRLLPRKPKAKHRRQAAAATIQEFPALIDYYIRLKENTGDRARSVSEARVAYSEAIFYRQLKVFAEELARNTAFYQTGATTLDEARRRVEFLKYEIENRGGHRIFYYDGQPIGRESDVHILYQLVWCGSTAAVSREVNDGRGPVDYKISRNAADQALVEFKLASNPQLKRNLERQLEVYKKASRVARGLKVIVYFSREEYDRVQRVLRELKLVADPDIILIDARSDNKPSGSRA